MLDSDLSAAFDWIDHSRLLAELGTLHGKGMCRVRLMAGVFEKDSGFAPTDEEPLKAA